MKYLLIKHFLPIKVSPFTAFFGCMLLEIYGLYINMIIFFSEALLTLILLVVNALRNSGNNVSLVKG